MELNPPLTPIEKEVLILKSAIESINSMVNYEVLDLFCKDPDSTTQFKSTTHRQYFNIILLDFLHSKVFQAEVNCLEALRGVCTNPHFGLKHVSLKNAVNVFQDWLEHDVELMQDGKLHKFWFPSIDSPARDGNIALKITRSEFIKICGNISKHNPLGLT